MYIKLIFLCVLLLTSCTGVKTRSDAVVEIATGASYRLQLPTFLQRPVALSQEVQVEFQGDRHRFIGEIEMTPTDLVLVGVSPLGATLFSIQHTAMAIQSKSLPSLEGALSPRFILADMQLVYWPIEDLQARLSGAIIQENDKGRVILVKGEPVIDITLTGAQQWPEHIQLEHRQRGYRLTIKTLSVTHL